MACQQFLYYPGFSLGRLQMGGFVPPILAGGGQVQGDKALIRGT